MIGVVGQSLSIRLAAAALGIFLFVPPHGPERRFPARCFALARRMVLAQVEVEIP
jgi:hypothetical protein